MKKYLLIFILVAATATLHAQFNKEPYQTKSLSSESFKTAEVRTNGGNITVTGVSASEAKIEVYVSANNLNIGISKEEIENRLKEKYDLEISVSNGKLTAIAKRKGIMNNDWKKSLSISFKLFLPKDVTTDLSTSGGNIHLSGMSANQEFKTSGGNLHIDDVKGNMKGKTSGGNIHLDNSSGEEIEVSTSGGNIHAKNCKGKMRLSTSGGNLDLDDLDGYVWGKTSGGNISGKNIAGEFISSTSGGGVRLSDLNCSVETSTSGGNIHVSITTPGKYVKIHNSGGNIELNIPKDRGMDLDLHADRIKTDRLENFTGKVENKNIQGKLNGGGMPVMLKAGGGKISLEFK